MATLCGNHIVQSKFVKQLESANFRSTGVQQLPRKHKFLILH